MSNVIVNVSAPVAWYRSSRKPNPSRIGEGKKASRAKEGCAFHAECSNHDRSLADARPAVTIDFNGSGRGQAVMEQ